MTFRKFDCIILVTITIIERSIEMTRQQQLIFQLIQESNDHPTADQLYWQARQVIPNISAGTVYRNLSHMSESGIIRRLTVPGVADRFDKSTTPHGHAICKHCAKMVDVFSDQIEQVIEEALGMDILSYELNVSYVCTDCRNAPQTGNVNE